VANVIDVDVIGPLPPALSSMWRLCKLGYRHEPRLMLAAFGATTRCPIPKSSGSRLVNPQGINS